MGLHEVLGLQPCHSLQGVYVLCVAAHEHPLLLQQTDEVVTERRLELPRIEFLGEGKEGLWMFLEVANLKNGLWVGKMVLLQVGIKAGGWGAEVGDARRRGDSSSHQTDDSVTALTQHVASHPFQGEVVQQTLLLGAQAQRLGEQIPQEVHLRFSASCSSLSV